MRVFVTTSMPPLKLDTVYSAVFWRVCQSTGAASTSFWVTKRNIKAAIRVAPCSPLTYAPT